MSKTSKFRVKHKKSIKKFPYIRVKSKSKTRQYKILKTGRIINRREKERLFPPQSIKQKLGRKKGGARIAHNKAAQERYERLVEDFIRKKKREGFPLSKRGARNSSELKKAVRGLRSRDPDRKAQALFDIGRIREEDIVHYVHKFEEESGGVKLKLRWRVVSKKTGQTIYQGSYRDCIRWLTFGTRRKRYRLESEAEEDDDQGEEE